MRTLKYSLTLGGAALALSTQLGACNAVSDDCSTYQTCPDGSSGSSGGGTEGDSGAPSGGSEQGGQAGKGGANVAGSTGSSGDAGHAGSGSTQCDTSKSPHDEPCLVSDEFAVFVSPEGDDDNAGTQDAPFATLTKAAESAGEMPVLVCNATYDEHVAIANGIKVYGGFKCRDWSAEAATPLFKPTTAGPALKIDTVADPVLIDGVGFEVGDASTAGATALAAFVNKSSKVTLRNLSLKAGKGQVGADGTLSNFAFPEAGTLDGHAENPAKAGGDEKECVCQSALTSVGGLGGPASSSGANGARGLPDHGGGLGGDPIANDCGGGSSGKKGNDAPARVSGVGAATLGATTTDGWLPAAGADGETGQPGQGGGGGASLNSSGHGGGGGCGGCGGNGGGAGKGGGASIALLAVSSPVAIEASVLTSADAGNGGKGAAGQPGQQVVGVGGGTVSALNSCPGGVGGKGGAGGAGGGGAGGISVGIVWKGTTQPSMSADTTISVGKAGDKGMGGVPGTNDGIAGVSQKVLPLN